MFSGIVEAIGSIIREVSLNGCKHFTISHSSDFSDLNIGDSIAVNGTCLTVTQFTPHTFDVTAVPETLRLTNLGLLKTGDMVNLERSLTVNSRIGGHQVQGHVEGTGQIMAMSKDNGDALLVKISLPASLAKYVIAKGYITLDGMSITVIESTPNWFTVTFIPHTQQVTIVKHYQLGDLINIEVDILGKYVEKLLGAYTHANAH